MSAWTSIRFAPSLRNSSRREGTDYGDRAYSLPEKVSDVMAQLKRGEAVILWDPATETLTLEAR